MYESNFEEKLYNERRDKLRQIAALGQKSGLTYAAATYPNSYAFTHTIPQLRAAYDPISAEQFEADHAAGNKPEVSIAGRIMALRAQGKAGFAQLQQNGQRMQIYVRKDDVGEDAFALYKLLDLGDHIGVRGFVFRTRTGELTLHVAPGAAGQPALTFLAKAMLALPDKYHGLEDTELRYRQRYVDLFMNTGHSPKSTTPTAASSQAVILSEAKDPDTASTTTATQNLSPTESPTTTPDTPLNVREVFVKRAAILRALRTFFDTRGYLEVETPMMHTIAGGAAARPFTTHHNALDIPLKLRIAPELYLKRLVVGGMDRVYEINRNFRNEGISTQHNPEFTMLEFYQAYSSYKELMKLTPKLIAFVANEVNGTTKTIFNGAEIDLAPEKWQQLSMREAIIKFWDETRWGKKPTQDSFGVASWKDVLVGAQSHLSARIQEKQSYIASTPTSDIPLDYLEAELTDHFETDHMFLSLLSDSLGRESQTVGKTIAEVFEYLAEPHLTRPTIIYDYPLAVSPLSKQKPDEPDWVERFEFYIGGFEIGNAFSELNDPDDQRARFAAQLLEKARGDEEAMAEVDEDYVRALGYGLPPTAGEGIGIDRLTMILTGSRSIRDVILFPLLRPQTKPTPTDPNEAGSI